MKKQNKPKVSKITLKDYKAGKNIEDAVDYDYEAGDSFRNTKNIEYNFTPKGLMNFRKNTANKKLEELEREIKKRKQEWEETEYPSERVMLDGVDGSIEELKWVLKKLKEMKK